jgi:hypothetical protein
MTAPKKAAVFSAVPDEAFRLSIAERAKLPATINAEALQRLLSWVRPENRAEILGFYQQFGADKVAFGPAFGTTGNSTIDRIIEQVVVAPR